MTQQLVIIVQYYGAVISVDMILLEKAVLLECEQRLFREQVKFVEVVYKEERAVIKEIK
ncbi:hypothetical protein [uncultured Clostridium sp.]|uniref:hypothetical protein n=1 Tax=uncultured Clostridium sp. TaxID=59620 RepID=UPI002672D397|nr:hypothetical protein [uncultured Clostridium sp.]